MDRKIDSNQHPTGTTRGAGDRLLLRAGLRGGPWMVALAIAGLLLGASALALPAIVGGAVNAVIDGQSAGSWLVLVGALLAVLVICDALDDVASGYTAARSIAWVRRQLLEQILALGARAEQRFSGGELTTRLVGNASEVGRTGSTAVRAAANLIPAIGAVVALAIIDPWLCLTFLAGMALLSVFVRAFARDASELAGRYFATQGRIASRLTDAISGSRTIAAAGTEGRERERVLTPLSELRRHGIGMWRVQMRIVAQHALVVGLVEIAVLVVAGVELANDRISAGELVAATQYVVLGTALGGLVVAAINQLARSRAAAARVAEVLSAPAAPKGTRSLPAAGGRLEFRDVSLRSGDEVLLNHLDLEIPSGSLVGVVGASGAGKSLLARLSGRLIDPDEGEVLLDGVPLSEIDADELRREVSFGFEDPALLGETVADAIAFGGHRPSSTEVIAAARAARADDFIRRMPRGYQTPLGDAPMSGGETQRIGLARTFAHAGRLLVFDDVASSLDMVTEHQISEVLTGAFGARTRIVIAHRASTAARMDFVVWLEHGTVRARAPHQALWQDPDYRALFGSQDRFPGLRVAGDEETAE